MKIVLKLEMTITIDVLQDDVQRSTSDDDLTNARCDVCGWSRTYKSPLSAKKGLSAHSFYCKKARQEVNRMFKRVVSG